jgi:hypothetical protein
VERRAPRSSAHINPRQQQERQIFAQQGIAVPVFLAETGGLVIDAP